MIAVDAGFLFALLDKSDAWHSRALAAAPTVQEGWITTWPALTGLGAVLKKAMIFCSFSMVPPPSVRESLRYRPGQGAARAESFLRRTRLSSCRAALSRVTARPR